MGEVGARHERRAPPCGSNPSVQTDRRQAVCGRFQRTGLIVVLCLPPWTMYGIADEALPRLGYRLSVPHAFFGLLGQAVPLKLKDPSYTELTNS